MTLFLSHTFSNNIPHLIVGTASLNALMNRSRKLRNIVPLYSPPHRPAFLIIKLKAEHIIEHEVYLNINLETRASTEQVRVLRGNTRVKLMKYG